MEVKFYSPKLRYDWKIFPPIEFKIFIQWIFKDEYLNIRDTCVKNATSYTYYSTYFYFVLCIALSIIQSWNKREPETSLSLTLGNGRQYGYKNVDCVRIAYIQVNQSYLYGSEESYRARCISLRSDRASIDEYLVWSISTTRTYFLFLCRIEQLNMNMEYDLKNGK